MFARTILAALSASEFTPKLVLTQPDRPKGRGRAVHASPVKQLAHELKLPIAQVPNLRGPENLQPLVELAPDVLVVAAYGLILPAQVLALPRLGCINVHASLLPRWRGAAPIERAIMAGDRETGVCIMQMDAGLDTGPVLSQQRVAIEPEHTAQPLEQALAEVGAALLIKTLRGLPAPAQPQPTEGITYADKLTAADRVANWRLGADDVHQQHLSIAIKDRQLGEQAMDVCFVNSKGFGGNNASALLLAPHVAERMLRKRHGEAAFAAYLQRREATRHAAQAYDAQALLGDLGIIYNFGNDLIDDKQIEISAEQIKVPGFAQPLLFKKDERYGDMLD